jgi:alkanesulfonate monooxygenase
VSGWPESLSFIIPPHSESFGLGVRLTAGAYLDRLAAYTAAAERIGVVGAFVYDFPVAMDPWLAAFDVLISSARLEPIIAVRPHQETAESAGRRLADLAYRFGRPSHLNVVAGATRPSRAGEDRVAVRAQLAAFAADVRAELDRRTEDDGDARRPLVFTPSSSTPGLVPADCVLMMARPRAQLAEDVARVRDEQKVDRVAMLVGMVVRETDEAAWQAASALYRRDRRQEIAGRMFMSQVVSSEHTSSYALGDVGELHDERLWYGAPARGIDAPKLVGSARQAAAWLSSCRDLGITDLIVDLVPDPSEYSFIGQAFENVSG